MQKPLILTWLAKRAGMPEARAASAWDSIVAEADRKFDVSEHGQSDYWAFVVERLEAEFDVERPKRNARLQFNQDLSHTDPFTKMVCLQVNWYSKAMLAWSDVAVQSTRAFTESLQRRAA